MCVHSGKAAQTRVKLARIAFGHTEHAGMKGSDLLVATRHKMSVVLC